MADRSGPRALSSISSASERETPLFDATVLRARARALAVRLRFPLTRFASKEPHLAVSGKTRVFRTLPSLPIAIMPRRYLALHTP